MFEVDVEILTDRIHKYSVRYDQREMSFEEVITSWQTNGGFRTFFNSLLSDSPFSAFRWETPPITRVTVSRAFEFVLLDSPGLAREPDRKTFATQISAAERNGVAVFENLGGDAVLVVPSPSKELAYDQIANFVRNSPADQMHSLWRNVGAAVERRLADQPLWLNTAGGGVAWLHVRLDSSPKYYGYLPFKASP